jgi:hypothetical protein
MIKDDFNGELVAPKPKPTLFQEFLHAHYNIRDWATHNTLHEDLFNHIWIYAANNPVTNFVRF